jgi:hypothetical protein
MLHSISIWFLILSGVAVVVLAGDVIRNPQRMAIMNWVWPITALYFGPFAVWSYFGFGCEKRSKSRRDLWNAHEASQTHHEEKPFWQRVWIGTTHCGAGCTLGDIVAEWGMYLARFTLLGSMLWASYLWDFVLAYLLGIIF